MQPIILMRKSLAEEGEYQIAKTHLPVITHRSEVQGFLQPLVIPRYALLPFPEELETDVAVLGGTLINSTRDHFYVADMQNWYRDFEGLTPRTWFQASDVPQKHPGKFVLKGSTNSRKALWRTHMLATSRSEIGTVMSRLWDDSLIASQRIYVREFVDFATHPGEGINGLPITHEFRFFILDGEIISSGFYWSEHYDRLVEEHPGIKWTLTQPPVDWVQKNICPRIKDKIRFVVADVAQRQNGEWMLVELNDGSMSGVSCCDMDELYKKLKFARWKERE